MRHLFFLSLLLVCMSHASYAQSLMDNIPPVVVQGSGETAAPPPPVKSPPANAPAPAATPSQAASDPYTVSDINADVTADNASHARDQALMQAERSALTQVYARVNAPDTTAKMDDDTVAALVQSFEVQSEHLSAVRYKGVFTIRFKPMALQKRLGKYLAADTNASVLPSTDDTKPAPSGPVLHLPVTVQTLSLADWTQIKKRLNAVPSVAKTDVIDLGRGVSHIDVSYTGSLTDLQETLTAQGLVLRQTALGAWELYDGSMVAR